ncbi:hypothetical protein K7X08_036946 [Anisodus acutangulus]|uniref:Uncharacterized protein n=1 Tax=Anisodus acutangulus TaxID=402998 RepID=A0A9Q1QWS7_9SOLA|nr:hypothetical protein K7X08_036946 [Anisodus acutangulus]
MAVECFCTTPLPSRQWFSGDPIIRLRFQPPMILPPLTKSNMCILSIRPNWTRPIARPKIICNMNIAAAGQSDEPHKFNLENILDQAGKLWDSAPTPVKSFPWNKTLDNFVQLILDTVLAVTKYLYVPVLVATSISELSYCAHERKLYITLFPILVGVAIAGILKSAALESSPYLKNAEVPWHLIAIGVFFTLLKLPGPYYPYWVFEPGQITTFGEIVPQQSIVWLLDRPSLKIFDSHLRGALFLVLVKKVKVSLQSENRPRLALHDR